MAERGLAGRIGMDLSAGGHSGTHTHAHWLRLADAGLADAGLADGTSLAPGVRPSEYLLYELHSARPRVASGRSRS